MLYRQHHQPILIKTKGNYSTVRPLADALAEYAKESAHGRTFSLSNASDYVSTLFSHEDAQAFIAIDPVSGQCAGFSFVGKTTDFWQEPFGNLMYFYVTQDYRGTHTGRLLLEASVQWFDENQCSKVFATDSASIGEDKLFNNLLAKYGFKKSGNVLQRG